MAAVLRVPEVSAFGDRPASAAYVAHIKGRPAFDKVRAVQIAHFAAADREHAGPAPS